MVKDESSISFAYPVRDHSGRLKAATGGGGDGGKGESNAPVSVSVEPDCGSGLRYRRVYFVTR